MCAKCQFDSTAECRIQLKQHSTNREKLQLQLQIASRQRCTLPGSLEMRAPNYICGSWYKSRVAELQLSRVDSGLETADKRETDRQTDRGTGRQAEGQTEGQTDSSQFSRRCSSRSNKRHLLIHMLTKCVPSLFPPYLLPCLSLSLGQLSKCCACEIFPPSFEVLPLRNVNSQHSFSLRYIYISVPHSQLQLQLQLRWVGG